MTDQLLNRRDLEFLLYELLDTEGLLARPRYREHSRQVFDEVMNTAEKIAVRYFANHYQKGDAEEPTFDGEQVHQLPEIKAAWQAVAEAGFMAMHQDYEEGGLQFPSVLCSAAGAYFSAANIGTSGYHFLTTGACNLIRSFGTADQKARFMPPMMDGRFAGTMALTEPGQGSSLGDIKTTAVPADDGTYRIKGQKMFISNGDHSVTENIIHLVLAKIEGAPAGVKGISLFIVPKVLVNDDGSAGPRNDVALAGLLHKMGYRNATSTVLNFGENGGAVGYLVGEPHQGLRYMFQMMNEARIGVGSGAAVLAYRAYLYSLNYARERPQGRLPSNKDPQSSQVRLIDHADVRRLLLAQKAYAEGALALCLFASSLVEDAQGAESDCERQRAQVLLDVLTPVVKSWPSKYGCVSNDLAIQVLGGSGYIREYPVEQLYRDQRLNPIHEGTEGIQGLDLLGRKVGMNKGYGLEVFKQEVRITVQLANNLAPLAELRDSLEQALRQVDEITVVLLDGIDADPDAGLANATLYLDFFGRVVMAWIWLKQAVVAARALGKNPEMTDAERHFYEGKLQAARYYFEWELPQIAYQRGLLAANNRVCFDMRDAWF